MTNHILDMLHYQLITKYKLQGVPVNCETKREAKYTETKPNETKPNEIHRNETKFTETKRYRCETK